MKLIFIFDGVQFTKKIENNQVIIGWRHEWTVPRIGECISHKFFDSLSPDNRELVLDLEGACDEGDFLLRIECITWYSHKEVRLYVESFR